MAPITSATSTSAARWASNRVAQRPLFKPLFTPLFKRYRAPAAPFARRYTAGYVRIDTVHQGDLDGVKGVVYHVTCVDEVSQWQVQACVQGISEAFLLPVLALVLQQFLFEIVGFHSDNGSEYINGWVAKLLQKLLVEQTKSRSRQWAVQIGNDNALAESKNASVVRKHMGYSHIPQKYAKPINAFYQEVFNPWLNLHRPCMFASQTLSPKGKLIKRYRHEDVKTPLAALQATADAQTDLAAAQAMQGAKAELFRLFRLFSVPRAQPTKAA